MSSWHVACRLKNYKEGQILYKSLGPRKNGVIGDFKRTTKNSKIYFIIILYDLLHPNLVWICVDIPPFLV